MSDPSVTPESGADPDETPAEAEVEASGADETATFQNRASRRSKGKKAAPQQSHGATQRLDGRPVQGPRQWGNRRSG